MRGCLKLLVLLLAAPGCSRDAASTDEHARLAHDAPDGGAPAAAELPATHTPAAGPSQPTPPALLPAEDRLASELARLTAAAAEHERRGYFEPALAARRQTAALLASEYGADSWQARSVAVAVARAERAARMSAGDRRLAEEIERLRQRATRQWTAGQRSDAIAAMQQVIDQSQRLWGADDVQVAYQRHDLAQLHQATGDLARAVSEYRQVLAARDATLGRKHPDTLAAVSALGIALQFAAQNAAAEPQLREAVDLSAALWGKDHPDYATHLNNLGMLYHGMNEPERALPLLTTAADVRRHVLGPQHPVLAHSLFNLGSVHAAAGDHERAAALLREAVAILDQPGVDEERLSRMARTALAQSLMALREFAAAEGLLRKVGEETAKLYGQEHPQYAECLERLGVLLANRGDMAQADTLLREAVAVHRQTSGRDHPLTRQAEKMHAELRDRVSRAGGTGPERGNEKLIPATAEGAREVPAALAEPARLRQPPAATEIPR